MTTLCQLKTRCSLCGSENEFTGIGSTNAFGSPDLDTRPPEMQRSTIFAWVQRCKQCGYCASDVGESRPGSKSVVRSPEYRRQLEDRRYPELANSFICKGILDRETNDLVGATWALVHAAWACDDDAHPDEAMTCRRKAARMLVAAEKDGQVVAEQGGAGTALLVDLLRRSGRMDDARKAIDERCPQIAEGIIFRILVFQRALIEAGDTSCHLITEALGEGA